eukprot:gene41664-51628_t
MGSADTRPTIAPHHALLSCRGGLLTHSAIACFMGSSAQGIATPRAGANCTGAEAPHGSVEAKRCMGVLLNSANRLPALLNGRADVEAPHGAGIAMGLIKEDNRFAVLTDIL